MAGRRKKRNATRKTRTYRTETGQGRMAVD